MWTPKVISLIQIMFHAVNTLLALVPFSARHLHYEILYLLIAFVVLTDPGFPISTPMSSASVSAHRKPWRIQVKWPLWGAEPQENMRRVYVLQSHHRAQSWLMWIWLGMQMNSSHEMQWVCAECQVYLFYLPCGPPPLQWKETFPPPCRVIWSQTSLWHSSLPL